MRIFSVVTLVTLLVGCGQAPQTLEQNIRPIDWVEVEARELEQVRRLAGTVEPVETANLSFLVGGKVAIVDVVLGQKVTPDQMLAKLDQRAFNLNYQTAVAQLQQATATYNEAKNEYERYAELVKQGVVSQSGFDNAKAAYETAASARDVARSQLEISEKDLQDSTLLAPYSGVITQRSIEPSQQVSPGQAVFQIEGEDGFEVQISVPETLIQMISVGTNVPVHFPALPNQVLNGVVSEVGTRAASANAFPVTLVLSSAPDSLRAGMTAEVDVNYHGRGRSGATGDLVLIPISAVAAGAGENAFVFVFDQASGTVVKTPIQTEALLNNQVYVSSGIQPGDVIAIAGVSFLRDGQKVSLLDKNTQLFN